MIALSILQPWAWLIVNGHKDIENRTWSTHRRGRFLVHAGKKWGPTQRADLAWVGQHFPHIELPTEFELGGVVGEARLADCVWDSRSPWFFGPCGLVLVDAKPLPFLPYRGQLGWFRVPEVSND